LSAGTDGAFEWALRWHHWRVRKEALGELSHHLSSFKPRLAPALQVTVTHVVRHGALVPAEFVLTSERPFLVATKVDPWMMPVMAEFDGHRTSAELYKAASEASALPESFKFNDLIDLIVRMVDRGYLDADDSLLAN
jgi:hypothetical protein